MILEIEAFDNVCTLKTFQINGIKADENEFVNKYDHSPETGEEDGCGDMQADIIPAVESVLKKYGISKEEYMKIAEQIADEISFGDCGLCI